MYMIEVYKIGIDWENDENNTLFNDLQIIALQTKEDYLNSHNLIKY